MPRFLIFATAILALPLLASGADENLLPSRKADVVLPLLKRFSPSDGYTKILQILGKEDLDTGSALLNCGFKLDDGSTIEVKASPNGKPVYEILRRTGRWSDSVEIIYGHMRLDKKNAP